MSEEQIELKKGLPPIGDLFNESWKLFQAKWLKLLIFFLIIMGISFVVTFVVILLFIGVGFALGLGSAISASDSSVLLGMLSSPSVLVPLGIITIVYFGAYIAFTIASQAGMILLIADEKTDQSAFLYLKKGFPYIVPLFVVGIINFILVMGGLFVLVIPGAMIMIFLGYSMYIAVLENKKAMDAIHMSASMVSQNFWAIVGRMLLFLGLNILVQLIIGQIGESDVLGPLAILLILPLSVGVSWFSIAYGYSLYKHARAAYDESKKSSITWMWVVAIIGWIFIVLSFGGIMKMAGSQEIRDAFMEGYNGEVEKEIGKDFESVSNENYDTDIDQLPTESL